MNQQIPVWDILIRLFHWSLALSFFIAYISGEDESLIHIYSGYFIIGLLLFRIVWGFIGTQHARFSDFIYSPKQVTGYLKSLLSGQPQHYIGHNPAGSWMVFALLISLSLTSITGLKLYAVEEGLGPLAYQTAPVSLELISKAHADDDDDEHEYESGKHEDEAEEFWEELHEAFSNLTVFLVFLHIAGVVVASLVHGENLVKAMINGRKQKHEDL